LETTFFSFNIRTISYRTILSFGLYCYPPKQNLIKMIAVFFFMFIFVLCISIAWVNGIDNMMKNHPDYKGEDFLNWDKMKKYENDLYK
jgi:hypothetical protein